MRSNIAFRTRLIGVFFIGIAVLLVARLYVLQIARGEAYRRSATAQYVEQSPDTLNRGNIYFTTKDGALVAAAVMQSGYRIAITPGDIADPERAYESMNAITKIDRERYDTSIKRVDDPYEEIAFRVSDDAAKKIRALKIKGVLLVQDQWRTYPGGHLAAQAVGFVGFKGDKRVGVYGLERQFESTLIETTTGLYVNPFAEIFANVGALLSRDTEGRQGDIITSIEPAAQAELEKVLDGVMSTYSPKIAGGIVMDPRTGEIRALGMRPGFDPNSYNTVDDPSVFGNPLVEGRYELGSIMKPITVAVGIDSGAITPATTYYDAGCIERSTKTICNYDRKARHTVPMQEVLNQSLNLGVTFITDKMTHPVFTDYMRAFGFGSKTGIDLPNEVTGDISTLGEGRSPDVNYAAASFGQGVSVSPIAMTRALSALANGGMLPNPHVVTAVRYESGITREIAASSSIQVLKSETARTVSEMLTTVFDEALLNGKYKMEHYSIAAKTGTAQIAVPGRGYYEDRFLHSFFGYFPAQDPKLIVFLFTVEPHGAEFASATLAQPFDDLAKFLINYYDIPPDR
ncbi:MAG: penicillin-binding protein 2 [Candidatus Pacebacteria bacterium]|nr:penicillin-binding protein 2 [Candidatus Paceibacterota bacterium]